MPEMNHPVEIDWDEYTNNFNRTMNAFKAEGRRELLQELLNDFPGSGRDQVEDEWDSGYADGIETAHEYVTAKLERENA